VAPKFDINTLKQGESVKINGKRVTNYSAMFVSVDGMLISKDRFNDLFGINQKKYDMTDKLINGYSEEITEGNLKMKNLKITYSESKAKIDKCRHEIQQFLAEHSVSDETELKSNDRKKYDEIADLQKSAQNQKNRSSADIISLSYNLVNKILSRGRMQYQQILFKNYT